MVNRKKIYIFIVLLATVSAVFTFYFYNFSINIQRTIYHQEEIVFDSTADKKPVVYISVISRYPPNVIYSGYQPIMDYLTSATPYRCELKLCDDYKQAVQLLITKEAAAAFLGSYVYITAHKEHGIIPIVKPLNSNHEPFSRSVLFTTGTKNIFSVNDIKNKKLALPSKESYSSNWLLHYVLKKNNIKQSDLAHIENFPHHQSVIQNVLKEQYDVGVTREYLIKKIQNRNIRILLYSDPFPSSPIVAAKDYSPEIINAIKSALLKINAGNSEVRQITKGWDNEFIYGFVEANDADYNAVRAIMKNKQ